MFQAKKSPDLSVSLFVFPLPVFMARATILCRQETCRWHVSGKEKPRPLGQGLVFALPIFTASHPATIVGANELNFCVRDGNRWTLIAINTNSCAEVFVHFLYKAVLPRISVIRRFYSFFTW